ncbi:MAG TPA: SusC/RagA family TonB-linked outer membrane protein [Longimicrobiales bacterium]|nr:SusC/RagA family TonB-linked outer membrane protein [Longimicrobiales bacterium]
MLNVRTLMRPSVLGLAAVFAFGGLPSSTAAQENFGSVVGAVTAEDTGQPLASATVLVEGTGLGALANSEGRFTILNIPPGTYTLQASSIGYSTSTVEFSVTAGETAVINVALGLDPLALDEIVVTGYGTARKEELTGSIVSIAAPQLELPTTTTFQDVMQGSPGVLVTSLDGAPGAGFDIRVRGQGSITAGAEPLYVVDGVPMFNNQDAGTEVGNGGRTGNTMASFNPNDIESIVVLKDAASTAIYGSRGANGVVLITTKGGVAGSPIWSSEPQFTLRAQMGVSNFAHDNLLSGLTAEQYRDYYLTARQNDGMSLEDAQAQLANQWPISDGVDNRWSELIARNGVTNQLDLSATGGSERFTYFLSAGRFDQQGNVYEQFFTRWSSRANLTARLTDNFTLSNNLSVSYTDQNGINDGSAWEAPFYMAVFMPPLLPMYDEDGYWYHRHTNVMGANHPVGGLYENPKQRETQRVVENLSGTYRFNDQFSAASTLSFDLYNIHDYVYQNMFFGDGRNTDGFVDDSRVDAMNWQSTTTVTYDDLLAGSHSVNTVVGYETSKNDRERTNTWGEGFAHPDLKQVTSAAITQGTSTKDEYAFESFFGRVNYDFDRTYYLSGSYRRDGSSRFGPEERWGDFWSVGAGLTLTSESLLGDMPVFDYLKLRGSYGEVGNAEIGNYAWQGLYGFARDYDGLPGSSPSGVANPALTWESQGALNVGFDYAILDNRISGSLDYYRKTSTDLLLDVPTSLTTGFRSRLQNFGDMVNSGLEFSMAAEVVRAQDYDFSLNFSITTQSNEITRLREPIVDGTKRREEGRDYQEYYLYGWAGVNPDNGDPQWYTDASKTTITSNLSEAERFYDGKTATPSYLGSFGFQGRFRSFSLSTLATYMFGHHLYEGAARFYHGDGRYLPRSTSQFAYENAWRQPGDQALFPRFSWGGVNSSQPSDADRWLVKGDYIRFKDVTLTYQFPQAIASSIRLSSLRAQLNVTNAWTWVADENLHFDPEQIVSGVYNTGTPNSRTFSFGLTMGF